MRKSTDTIKGQFPGSELIERLTQRMHRFRLNYCSVDWKEAPFEQIRRIAKALNLKPVEGMLFHSLLPLQSQLTFGHKEKK